MEDHVGFWKEFIRYRKIADKATDLFLKSLDYEYGSDEWHICRHLESIERRKLLPILQNLINYLETHTIHAQQNLS